MKRSIELLLLLPVVGALVFIIVGFRNGTIPRWFSVETPTAEPEVLPTATFRVLKTSTPTIASSLIPYYTATSIVTPTPRASPTSTSIPTFVVMPRTNTPLATRTNTPLPTATRTSAPNSLAPAGTTTPGSQEMQDGIAAGNEVVQAIEDYYLANGQYPATLADLIPVYMPGLPVTPAGQPYFYRLFDVGHPLALERYWLSFRVSDQPNLTCTYMRRIEYWDCNYASP